LEPLKSNHFKREGLMTLSEEEKKEIRAAYFKSYYDNNKTELARKRKEKYDSDPEYRAKIRQYSVARQERKKAEFNKLVELGMAPVKVYKKRGPRTYTVEVNGERLQAYAIAEVAKKIGKSKFVLISWTQKGIIPASPVKTKKGFNLYTDCMIGAIEKAIYGKKFVFVKDNVDKDILNYWKDCGVMP
jgi:hypothetical protein